MIKNIPHTIRRSQEWLPKGSIFQPGRKWSGVATALLFACLAPASLRAADPVITEFMASNSETLVLEGGGHA